MKKKVTIAAVGDILMWKEQVACAKLASVDQYSFADMFAPVAPILSGADLTIGNLETTFSGKGQPYQIGSARTGYPRFNCPDELARDLKQVGFDVVTTVNNHCLDGGPNGLCRTLDVLDRYKLAHTGTYRSPQEASIPFVREVNGIRIALLAYTYGTNKQVIPAHMPWLANLIRRDAILQDIAAIRPLVDLVIVALHFGVEFRYTPTANQRLLVQSLLDHGADVILGAHPHVLQPVVTPAISLAGGRKKRTLVAYSLGNFTSEKMLHFDQSQIGAILRFSVEKDAHGQVAIGQISVIPTYCQRFLQGGRVRFRVIPIRSYLKHPDPHLPLLQRKKLRLLWNRAIQIIGRKPSILIE
ncbi:CapA family protein [Brevibacillus agri]|uniref:CapA family protein n=1 Tax=Brevibacillus agri TaxID=51101 RepID=UPI0024C06937|nr:CapA family protein [Brevibacillus agri]WHX32522.1 CapA family protein [Brevibacillus agri]